MISNEGTPLRRQFQKFVGGFLIATITEGELLAFTQQEPGTSDILPDTGQLAKRREACVLHNFHTSHPELSLNICSTTQWVAKRFVLCDTVTAPDPYHNKAIVSSHHL